MRAWAFSILVCIVAGLAVACSGPDAISPSPEAREEPESREAVDKMAAAALASPSPVGNAPLATPTPEVSTPTPAPSPVTNTGTSARTIERGSGLPGHDFELTLFDGESLRLSDLRGKVVVLNFWAYDFGFGATFFDFDNDGDEDLYWLGSTIARGQGRGGDLFPAAGRMLRSNGQGSFEDITVRAHLLDIQDFDYSSVDPLDPGTVTRLTGLLVALHENGKGLAHGDFNGDGYVDLVATNSSGPIVVHDFQTEMLRGPIFLWLNGGGENRWITLRLTGRMAIDGTGCNADGIGARVYVKTTPRGRAEPLTQVQEVRAGSSYLSMDSIDLEFGVGAAMVIDEITILWPSGRKQVLADVSVDQVIAITEPQE